MTNYGVNVDNVGAHFKEAIYKYDTKSKRMETLKWTVWIKQVRKGATEE